MRLYQSIGIVTALCALSACDHYGNKPEPQPASLTRTLTLMGPDGNRYGTVELDPVTGGRMYDTQGRLIGTVVTATPATTPVVTTPVATPGAAY